MITRLDFTPFRFFNPASMSHTAARAIAQVLAGTLKRPRREGASGDGSGGGGRSSSKRLPWGHEQVVAKVGHVDADGIFCSGVPSTFAQELLRQLETGEGWSCVTPWTQRVRLHYVLSNGTAVCTTVHSVLPEDCPSIESFGRDGVKSKALAATADLIVTHETVTQETGLVLGWAMPVGGLRNAVPDSLVGTHVQIHVSDAAVVFEGDLPKREDACSPVIIEHIRSFVYTPPHTDRALWAYNVTLAWKGATRTEAEIALKTGQEPAYYAEVRCLDPKAALERCGGSIEGFSQNILAKTLDLFQWAMTSTNTTLTADACHDSVMCTLTPLH
jgi:hypothetical protein